MNLQTLGQLLRRTTKPTTPEQGHVIVWSFIAACVAMGTVGMWFSWQAPAEKGAVAGQLFWYSLACFGLAALIYGVKRAVDLLLG